jgi:hypothetical protein
MEDLLDFDRLPTSIPFYDLHFSLPRNDNKTPEPPRGTVKLLTRDPETVDPQPQWNLFEESRFFDELRSQN